MHEAAFKFIENLSNLSSANEVMDAFAEVLKQLGIDHFIFSFVPTATESFADVQLANRLPDGFLKAYVEQGFQNDDPGFRYSQITSGPFRWLKEAPHDPNNKRVVELLRFNRDFGIVDGMVIPVLSPVKRLGNVWFGGAEMDLPQQDLPALHLMVLAAFDRVLEIGRVPPTLISLTERESEVLTRIAIGEKVEQIAHALGLAQSTVFMHLNNCRRKLGARTLAQAVAIAIRHHMLRP
jgi:LuxR family quorum sensing-dependent transcriptional regulator